MHQFQKAVPVWGENLSSEYNQFLGFYTEVKAGDLSEIRLAIAARSYYRLFINGEFYASGPARTAKGYCRVDEITVRLPKAAQMSEIEKVRVAVETAAYNKPEKYSNDCTLEPGLFICEITGTDAEGNENILAATGDQNFYYLELPYRKTVVETMSHSRGIVESYRMDPSSMEWICGKQDQMCLPLPLGEEVTFLKRRAPYPSYRRIPVSEILRVNDIAGNPMAKKGFVTELASFFNPTWYGMIPEEHKFINALSAELETDFTGRFEKMRTADDGRKTNRIVPGKNPCAVTFFLPQSELGFIQFGIRTDQEVVVDVINTDHLHADGSVHANSYCTRYELTKGSYELMTFEPKLTKFVKLIFRTKSDSKTEIVFTTPVLLDDSYPDEHRNTFLCSDGALNRIYDAARRTLRLNTLDIFMDCPQRERGGWLCDSQFTAQAAWQLFGDLSVEKDFIENFMLTDADALWHSFFPEVYPGRKKSDSDVGIMNWSFWLMTELYDFYKRSGDKEFIEWCRPRVARFVEGVLSLRGESGLLEGMVQQFVDWSISNKGFNVSPISEANNCLAVHMLFQLAELYDRADWRKNAEQMKEILESVPTGPALFGPNGDSLIFEDGVLKHSGCCTESSVGLKLYSGFHGKDKKYIRDFVKTMGTCPEYRADPNIGKANLFIGLMLRFSVLSNLGEIETLVRELKDVYLPEIDMGSGTLFENINAFSGCHGFNGYAASLIVHDVLGLGEPEQQDKTVKISPHPGKLVWCGGSASCADGDIYLNWRADQEEHVLKLSLALPEGWQAKVEIPFEISNWDVFLNGELL